MGRSHFSTVVRGGWLRQAAQGRKCLDVELTCKCFLEKKDDGVRRDVLVFILEALTRRKMLIGFML